ncbi:MAG: class I SAM-dependent methyltransferase [Firmicutes bacterium]|nr:class I SAM-dependent methyltransferase [[Eubacterium] siraeum]MCM1488301.1 class I SAM-dependent methyltransferase [Bacillota bacterium]
MKNQAIDGGNFFDWGKTSQDYAKYRDIYPKEFYGKIADLGCCQTGQRVLDLGTGTGVLPRNMYSYGAKWTGTDASENQIEQAKLLSQGMDIDYYALPAEKSDFPEDSFDVITACQCFWYFDHAALMPRLHKMLKKDGSILILCMAWLPFEDKTALESERLVLKYNPDWSGGGETVHPIDIPKCYYEKFKLVCHEEYPLSVKFTRESWNGRMKACRGIGASLSQEKISQWEEEHKKMLEETVPEEFYVKHYAAIACLKKIL